MGITHGNTFADYPFNEEADIRAKLGRLKDLHEITWDDPTERMIYKWTKMSSTVEGVSTNRPWCGPMRSETGSNRKQERGRLWTRQR